MGKGTSCKDAIKRFEQKFGVKASEQAHVKLFCQTPPIQKMDAALNTLAACEHLSLSTNAIDKIGNLSSLTHLKILSLSRNNIKKIERLDDLADTLEEVWLSYNSITKIQHVDMLTNLRCFFIGNNQIRSFDEFLALADLPKLEEVVMVGNPCCSEVDAAEARLELLRRIPQLKKIDGQPVSPEEHDQALQQSAAGEG